MDHLLAIKMQLNLASKQ